jgi:hypothetical protein
VTDASRREFNTRHRTRKLTCRALKKDKKITRDKNHADYVRINGKKIHRHRAEFIKIKENPQKREQNTQKSGHNSQNTEQNSQN